MCSCLIVSQACPQLAEWSLSTHRLGPPLSNEFVVLSPSSTLHAAYIEVMLRYGGSILQRALFCASGDYAGSEQGMSLRILLALAQTEDLPAVVPASIRSGILLFQYRQSSGLAWFCAARFA